MQNVSNTHQLQIRWQMTPYQHMLKVSTLGGKLELAHMTGPPGVEYTQNICTCEFCAPLEKICGTFVCSPTADVLPIFSHSRSFVSSFVLLLSNRVSSFVCSRYSLLPPRRCIRSVGRSVGRSPIGSFVRTFLPPSRYYHLFV